MLHNTLKLFNIYKLNQTSIRCSALFINGAKASETYVHVQPLIDYHERLENNDLLLQELQWRKSNINVNKLKNLWGVYEELKDRKLSYDNKKAELSQILTKLMKEEPESADIKKLKLQIDLIKENVKKIKVPLWSAEESAVLEYLKLPNRLHYTTPLEDEKVIHAYSTQPKSQKDHTKIGHSMNLLEFHKNEHYYLKNDAAVFELGAKFYFTKMLKENGYIQFSNPDFVKSVIVEGCGGDHTDSKSTFILHHTEDSKVNVDSRLHLTGGGSLYSFMAYLTKNQIPPKYLPLSYFSMGRQYLPSNNDKNSLLHVSQASVIQVFQAGKDENDLETLLQKTTDVIKMLYDSLGYHYRLVMQPAHKLLMWESAKLSIEMYSSSVQEYVEVGNLSLSGDFISKRLMFSFVDQKVHKYPHLLSGVVLNVPKLLACILEQDNDFVIPKEFQVENWS